MDRPLLRLLRQPIPWCELGDYPSPVHELPRALLAGGAGQAFTKRDDVCSLVYGGSKVRALEPLLAAARECGRPAVYVGGANGSNLVLAAALHAPRVGLRTRAVVFPQPPGPGVQENLPLIQARTERLTLVPHWSLLPAALLLAAQRSSAPPATLLPPGGASPLGTLGHVSAALELAEQVERGSLPAPDFLVVGLGSGGTAAGLLLGSWLAARSGIGFRKPPELVAVRVAPWPLASRAQVLRLATQAAGLLARHGLPQELVPRTDQLWRLLTVDGSYLGQGYGYPTAAGQRAAELWAAHGLNALDSTYSAKVAAAFLARCRRARRATLLFWSTKSSVALPEP